MDNTNSKCAICFDLICCDSTKYKSIDLKCGHAFGKSCIQKWLESSNQKNCYLCQNPLTDHEIKEIKNIPLQERAVIISEKIIQLSGQAFLKNALPFTVTLAIGLAFAAATGTVVDGTLAAATAMAVTVVGTFAIGIASGAVCAAAGGDRAAARTAGAVVGGVSTGAGSVFSGALFDAFGTKKNAAAVRIGAALKIGETARALGFGVNSFQAVGFAAGAVGFAAGAARALANPGAVGFAAGAARALANPGAAGFADGAARAVVTAGVIGAAMATMGAVGGGATIGGATTMGAIGAMVGTSKAFGFIIGASLGAYWADAVYNEQENQG